MSRDGKIRRHQSERVRKKVTDATKPGHKLRVSMANNYAFTLHCDSDVSVAFVLSEAIREFGEEHMLTSIAKEVSSGDVDVAERPRR